MFNVGVIGRSAITPTGPAPPTPTTPHPCTPLSGSPGQQQDASSLDSNASGQISMSWGGRSPGKASPFRGRTMKEYEEQLATLKKDNFALKLRIYFLEERMGQKCDRDDKDDLYRTNIELKVETEALKQELYDKQELVRQASTALGSLEQQYQEQLSQARQLHVQDTQHLTNQIQSLQKEVDAYCEQLQGSQGRLGELTQLCGLAFNTEEGEAVQTPPVNLIDLSYSNPLMAQSPVQGVFSLPADAPDTIALERIQPCLTVDQDLLGHDHHHHHLAEEGSEVEQLRGRVVELEGQVEELEEELAQRQDTAVILEGDLANLRKEVEEKVEKIGQLEVEVVEKDQKVEAALQLHHSELAAKDHLIQSLHQDLHRVEPEIEVKVQEIVERDRIIEEKIEQIEQQNKILVEIQITLDEKQKQLADMEQKVEEAEQKVAKLTEDLDKSCKVIQAFAERVHANDKEIASLKKELKRKEKKIRDLVAEVKETLNLWKTGGDVEETEVEPEIEVKVQEIDERDRILEEKIEQIEQQNKILVEIQITLDEKQKQLADMEQKVEEAEQKVAKLTEDLDKSCKVIQAFAERVHANDKEIASLKKELKRKEKKIRDLVAEVKETLNLWKTGGDVEETEVEPEIEVKVQEIDERDRILEEKIEQIEQQNKILVEIQITLDEKRKQLADMEQKVEEAEQKVTKLTEDLDKSCKVIQAFAERVHANDKEIGTLKKELKRKEKKIRDLVAEVKETLALLKKDMAETETLAEEVHAKDKEIADLKKELKRKEKKVRDLVAELKETLDMLKKAKWEAETSGCEDGVKEMAEEENERLWAELESRKTEALAVQAEHRLSLAQAHDRLALLQEHLDAKLQELQDQKNLHTKETEEREANLREKAEQVCRLECEVQVLQGDMSSREGQLKTNQGVVEELQGKLAGAKAELQARKSELDTLQEELRKKNADMQDLVNRELWERNREVERLEDKLACLATSTRGQLQARDEEVLRLRARLAEEAGTGRAAAVAQVTVVAGGYGPDAATVNRPVSLSLTEDGGAGVQLLQREVSLVREEARALRLERSDLNNKLSSIQQLYDQTHPIQAPPSCTQNAKLDDSREKSEVGEQQQHRSVSDYQGQVEMLCGELQATKKKIGQQLSEVNACKYREALRRHKQEIVSLRKRLADSHNACDLLRTRLEELADFLERILELEEQGLISLSQLCPSQLASMHRSLDESRALSQSLSLSLMIGVDLSQQVDPTLLSASCWSLGEDTFSETHECPALDTLGEEALWKSVEEVQRDVSTHAAGLHMTLETKEFEITSDDSFCLTDKLVKSHQEIKAQAKVISELQAEVSRLSDQALPQHLCGSSADLSEPLPPPPFHLLQDSEASVVPVEGERWPASDTGTAIKASVNHPDHLQQQQQTEKPNSLGLSQEQSWAPVSPSESEAWSEPDRNVSLARIGLDTSSLGGGLERSTSRPRQHRSTAALTLTSESEAEVTLESCVPPPLPSPVSTGKASKRRSDVAELRRVATKLREVEQLNDTLRAELHIYQTLNQQLLPPPLHTRPSTSDKGVETHRGETADAAVGAEEASPAPGVLTLPASLLEDIRGLRGKLEEAIVNNDQLRDQLESALTAHPQDEARFLHLTAAIQTSQEEQREAREKLQASQITLREQEERCQQLHHKLQQCEAQLTQQQQQLEASQQQATAASIATSHTLQEKESAVKEQAVQLREREQEVRQLQGKVVQLQEEVSKVGRMQEELQVQEARLLEVNKERLTLVGERAKLQAQLVSASAQARLQEPNTSLLQELKAGRCTVATLQKEREVLVVDKEALEKGSQVLRDEVASLQATVTHLKARHTHAATPALQHPHGDTQHHPQDPHGDHSEHHANDSSQWSGRQDTAEDEQQCQDEQHKSLVRQLAAQLEAERQLTTNLQLQLKTFRATGAASPTAATTATSTTHCHHSVVEAISSPESVTSIEYYPQPLPDPSSPWRHPSPTPAPAAPQRERRSSSSGRRRERESSGRRLSSRWSENKENIFVSSTLTTATTSSSNTKRSRLSHNRESQTSLLMPPNHRHHSEEDMDGGTTSGESPDLGIGSDHHFSSLERATTQHHRAPITARLSRTAPLPTPNALCSEPPPSSLRDPCSHSALMVENQQLREESVSLKTRLTSTEETLKEAVERLSRSNQRKETMERAICKQLHKTHDVLKKAKSHLKQANPLPQ